MLAAALAASLLLSAQDAAAERPAYAPASDARRLKSDAPRKIGQSAPVEPSFGGLFAWTLVVLGGMGAAAFVLRRGLRNSRFLAGGGAITVLARKPVGARQDLLLVEVGRRVFLIGATRDRLSTLGEFASSDELDATAAVGPEPAAELRPEPAPPIRLGA
jgi:flagellar biogenesis protein FliO